MYKYLLESVEGVQWFGITALLIFFCTFLVALLRTFLTKKSDWDALAALPFNDEHQNPTF